MRGPSTVSWRRFDTRAAHSPKSVASAPRTGYVQPSATGDAGTESQRRFETRWSNGRRAGDRGRGGGRDARPSGARTGGFSRPLNAGIPLRTGRRQQEMSVDALKAFEKQKRAMIAPQAKARLHDHW